MTTEQLIQRLPRRLKMSELRVFTAVFEQRSFHKAAAVVHLTQPAVTKVVAGLEQMLGVKLFDRHVHGVEPTAHGLSFAPRAAAVFEELRRAAQDLALVSSGTTGTLRIGTLPMPAIPFVPSAMKNLLDEQPDVSAVVIEAREAELVDRLRKRDLDLAVLRLSIFDLDEDLSASTLFDEDLCVVAGSDHELASRSTLTWSELLRQRWVLPPADCIFYLHVLRTLDRLGLPMPRASVESFEIAVQYGMVVHGGMLGFGMRSQFEFAPRRQSVVRLPFELHSAARAVSVVSLKSRELSPLALQFIKHIRALTVKPQGRIAPDKPRLVARRTPPGM